MAIGEVFGVDGYPDLYYVDTGMHGVEEYGAVYVLDGERPALIETGLGTNYELILDALAEIGLAPAELAVIALTHVHLDHAGGAGYLVEECPNASVYVNERGAPHLIDPTRLWEGTKRAVGDRIEYYAEPKPIEEDRIQRLEDGDVISLGERALRAYHAPGHAPHQMVFYQPATDVLFTGDAAGIYVRAADEVRVTSPPPNFDAEECLDDAEMIRGLDPDTLCYTHFGPASTDDRIGEYERALAEWVQAVAEKRQELDSDEAVVDHFVSRAEASVWDEDHARAETRLNTRGVLVYLDEKSDPNAP